MRRWNGRYRFAILVGFGVLVMVLANSVINLQSQLRALSTAQEDNTQWSISQLDTEFANLNAELSEQLGEAGLDDAALRLRLDIVISRLGIVSSGRAAKLFEGNAQAAALIKPIQAFVDEAIQVSDTSGPLTVSDLRSLKTMVKDVRPNVRSVALLGINLSAARSEAGRAEFARQLSTTGAKTIGLLAWLGAFMVLLDRLFQRAAIRDAALVTSTRRLKSTISASLDGIITSDAEGRIIEYNPAAEKIFGWSRDNIIGTRMDETIIPHHMREAHNAGMKRYLNTLIPKIVDGGRVEVLALRKSGEEFPVELNVTSVRDREGTKFIAYLRDISERKINEQKLIDARDRAERTDQAKSQFLTVMSHEMRTPLNGILGVLDLLKTTKLTAQQERYAQIASASGEVLLGHINEALDITRIETGELQLSGQDFDLPELIASVADVLEPLAAEKYLGLSVDIEDAMRKTFHADCSRIRQILTNLIGNAVKFTNQGQIGLRVSGIHGPDISSVKFSVSDTGAGISAEQQEKIFQDFVALSHSEGRQVRGDGLGLAISRRIARQLGGDISVSSTLGVGSTFTLTVPLKRIAPAQPPPVSAFEPEQATPVGRNILVVEDNSINRKVLGDMLIGMGHQVSEAVNGADGVEKAQEARFDLIFMDISMPIMDGIKATTILRDGSGPNRATYIIGLTAHGREEYRDAATQAGMNSFHAKPIRMAALHAVLAQVDDPEPDTNLAEQVTREQLHELCDALGTKKVGQVGAQFFKELGGFVDQVCGGQYHANAPQTAEAAHKLKGAAALLGLSRLEDHLEMLEHDTRAEVADDLVAQAEALGALAQYGHAGFFNCLNQFDASG